MNLLALISAATAASSSLSATGPKPAMRSASAAATSSSGSFADTTGSSPDYFVGSSGSVIYDPEICTPEELTVINTSPEAMAVEKSCSPGIIGTTSSNTGNVKDVCKNGIECFAAVKEFFAAYPDCYSGDGVNVKSLIAQLQIDSECIPSPSAASSPLSSASIVVAVAGVAIYRLI